jgi:hypothetical protein
MIELLATGFAEGHIPQLIALLVVGEALFLVWLWRSRSIGIAPRALLGSLASGALLMLAIAAALRDAPWWDVAILLLLSLIAHLADLALRWRS